MDKMKQTDLPIGDKFSEEEKIQLFFLMKDAPYNNLELAYKILVPKTFIAQEVRAETDQLNPYTLKPLGIFKGPEENNSTPVIQIQAVQLVKEITAANWLRHYSIMLKRNIISIKPISNTFADCLMEFTIEGQRFTGRATASIDGDRLFFLLNLVQEEAYPKFADLFGVSVVSFNLQQNASKPTIEKHIPFNLNNITQFNYPESWKYTLLTEAPEGKSGVDFFNFDPDGNICGKIRVKSVEKSVSSVVDDQFNDTFEEYKASNVVTDQLLEGINVEMQSSRFDYAVVNAYRGHIEGNEINQEIWIAVIDDPKYFIIVTLLTPFREQMFYWWAVNRRAFDIVLGSLV
ncbi:MAG: hypothetical protein HQK65_22330 [Desulfamplus sp.]|nr:hypothetical protein [Desulfamplus sp.]